MKFVKITTCWILALLFACLLHSCAGRKVKEDASFVERIGEVTVVCLYGVRYGLQGELLTPLMGTDGWPLPCEDRTPETCEKRLLACQVDCLADQTTLRELENCEGLDDFVNRCIGGEVKSGTNPEKSVPANPYAQ